MEHYIIDDMLLEDKLKENSSEVWREVSDCEELVGERNQTT